MLDISPILLLVTGFVFFFLLIVLNKILYKPLLQFIDNRNESIKRDLENAGKNTSDVEAYYKEADQIIHDAKAEAGKIREAALSEAREIAAKKVEQKHSELEEEYTAFLKDLDAEKTEFQENLSAKIPLFRDSIKQKLGNI
ncbi:FoF1 ATP synthase subunit B' [Sulfurospirillum arcachonense]|uniref:FoF1 ATP synthase subunit B' n=1 Tax=Sulfurospirillum arcachonense TaxID=57666 RepID=UPI00046A1C6F|nr:FoF1 ATP synthase subunit B' [Sulfurospirillum arcachonense]